MGALSGAWFFIDVVKNEGGQVVDIPTKVRARATATGVSALCVPRPLTPARVPIARAGARHQGPRTVDDLKEMWASGKLDGDSYVWLEGKMEDFAQVKTLPELHGALRASGSAINARKAVWYYKDGSGEKAGPHFIDSLRIMYDFDEIDDGTPVFTDGMDEFVPLGEVAELAGALRSADPRGVQAEYDAEKYTDAAEEAARNGRDAEARPAESEQAAMASAFGGSSAADPLLKTVEGAGAGTAQLPRASTPASTTASRSKTAAAIEAPRSAGEVSESGSEGEVLKRNPSFVLGGRNTVGPMRTAERTSARRARVRERRGLDGNDRTGARGAMRTERYSSAKAIASAARTRRGAPGPGTVVSANEGLARGGAGRLHDRVAGAVARSGAFLNECENTMGKINSMYGSLADEFSKLEAEYSAYRERLEEEHQELAESLRAESAVLQQEVDEARARLEAVREETEAEHAAVEEGRGRVQKFERDVQEQKSKAVAFAQSERLKMERREEAVVDARAEVKLREEAVAREERAMESARQRLQVEKDAVATERKAVDDERAAIESDYAEFERIREDGDAADKLLQGIIAEERAAFEADKARAVAELEAARGEIEAERQAMESAKADIADDRVRLEFDWSQREAYLDHAQMVLSQERRAFEAEKAEALSALEADRSKIRQQMEAIKSFDEAQREMVQYELAQERTRIASDLEAERARLEQVRIDQTQRALAIHQRMQGFEASVAAGFMGAPATAPRAPGSAVADGRHMPMQASLAPTQAPGAGLAVAVAPAAEVAQARQSAATTHADRAPAVAQTPAAPSVGSMAASRTQTPGLASAGVTLPAVRVFRDAPEPASNLLGVVTLEAETTMGDVRRVIHSSFGVGEGATLRKKKVPILPTQDHHLALDFLRSEADYLVVIE